MSFPEGPMETREQSAYDDSETPDAAPPDGPLASVGRVLRAHFETWAGRYVEMRVEARTGRRD